MAGRPKGSGFEESRRPGTPRPAPARLASERPDERRAPASEPPPRSLRHSALFFVRYVVPAVVVVAGVVAMAFGTDVSLEGGAGLVSAGLAVFFINWLFRIGARGDEERDAEDRAREYFDRHGRWPEGR